MIRGLAMTAAAVCAATVLPLAPTASASEPTQSAAACGLEAYVDTNNGRAWAAGYTTPADCKPVGSLRAQLERDGVLVASGAQECRGTPVCSVASDSVGLGSTRHQWCSRVTFYANGTDPVKTEYGCRYIPA